MAPDTLRLAQKGDKEAFGQLVLEYEKMVYNIVYRMVRHEEDAKDIAQEAFIKAYRNIKKFDGRSSFSTWIYRIAVNTAIDAIRKKKNHVSMDETVGDEKEMERQFESTDKTPEERYLDKERYQAVLQAMHLLPADQKSILVLRDFQQLSYEEIAGVLDISLGTVKSRIARSRTALKKMLTHAGEQIGAPSRHKDRKEG